MKRFRWACLFETVLAMGVLVLINLAFFHDKPAYLEIHPHPYFALILLVSLRYPRLESLIATLLVCAGLGLQAHYDNRILLTALEAVILNKILLFVVLNLVLGELGGLFHGEVEEAREELADFKGKYEQLQVQYNALSMVKDELSERIVGQTSSLVSIYEAAKRLETLDADQYYRALLIITAKFIGTDKCSVWTVDRRDEKLVLAACKGWSQEEEQTLGRKSLPFEGSIPGNVARTGRMLTLRDIAEDKSLEHEQASSPIQSIMAAPLTAGTDVRAVLIVEQLPFLKFTPTTIRLFYLIADLGSTALQHSQRVSQMKDAVVIDPDTGLHTRGYFDTRLKEEMQRFKRTQLSFGVLVMRIDRFDTVKKILGKKVKRFYKELARLVFENKRDIDVVARSNREGEVLCLLPITEIEGGLVFAHKIQESVVGRLSLKVEDRRVRPSASFGCSFATARTASGEEMLDQARGVLVGGEGSGRIEVSGHKQGGDHV